MNPPVIAAPAADAAAGPHSRRPAPACQACCVAATPAAGRQLPLQRATPRLRLSAPARQALWQRCKARGWGRACWGGLDALAAHINCPAPCQASHEADAQPAKQQQQRQVDPLALAVGGRLGKAHVSTAAAPCGAHSTNAAGLARVCLQPACSLTSTRQPTSLREVAATRASTAAGGGSAAHWASTAAWRASGGGTQHGAQPTAQVPEVNWMLTTTRQATPTCLGSAARVKDDQALQRPANRFEWQHPVAAARTMEKGGWGGSQMQGGKPWNSRVLHAPRPSRWAPSQTTGCALPACT